MNVPAYLTRLRPRLRKAPGYRMARFLYKLVHSMESRHAALILLRPPRDLFQPFGTTSDKRYPDIFGFVRDQIGDGDSVRILSFGCSTGEEVSSLRRYFPKATIVGLDINPLNIAICRFRHFRNRDDRMHFAVAGSTIGEANSSYDAVFAMAVFRHGDLNVSPPQPRCGHRIRFADFERSVTDLARILKPGGQLAIQHAMFRFADTCVSSRFETSLTFEFDERGPVYGTDDSLLSHAGDPNVVFRKIH